MIAKLVFNSIKRKKEVSFSKLKSLILNLIISISSYLSFFFFLLKLEGGEEILKKRERKSHVDKFCK